MTEAPPVKLIAAVLFCDRSQVERAKEQLIEKFGPIDYVSPSYPFDRSRYYEPEMGEGIQRLLLSFRTLVDPSSLREIKMFTNAIEDDMREGEKRVVNIDSGYLDYAKVVLASMKSGNQKIYMGDGVYADMILFYEKGGYKTFDWTFPDFKGGAYLKPLLHIRATYKGQMRRLDK